MKLTDDKTKKKRARGPSNNNLTLARANERGKTYHGFLHRGKLGMFASQTTRSGHLLYEVFFLKHNFLDKVHKVMGERAREREREREKEVSSCTSVIKAQESRV